MELNALAPVSKRIGAGFIDSLIVLMITVTVTIILVLSIPNPPSYTPSMIDASNRALGFICGFLIDAIYTISLMASYRNSTFGQRAVGIRLYRVDGKSITFVTVIVRYIVSIFSTIFFKLGYLIIFFTEYRQTLHDLAAGTTIVNDESVEISTKKEGKSGDAYQQSANIREKTDRAVHGRAESAKSGGTYKHADDKPRTQATTSAKAPPAPAIQPPTNINTSIVVAIIFIVLSFAWFFFSSKKSAESPAVNNSSNASGSASVACTNIDGCLKATMNAISKNDVAMVRAIAAKIETFGKPLRGNSNYARQLNAEGLVAIKLDDFTQAATVFEKANREDPSDAEIAGNLGYARVKAGDFVGGSRALMEALQLSPRRESTWLPIAELYARYHQNTNDAAAAILVAYEWSNKEEAIERYTLQAEIEPHPQFKAAYKQALQVISPGLQQFRTDKEPAAAPKQAELPIQVSSGEVISPCAGTSATGWTYCKVTHTWPDGKKYAGELRDDKPHGQGAMTLPDGSVLHSGQWLDGEPVR